jgi:hypothetical protein
MAVSRTQECAEKERFSQTVRALNLWWKKIEAFLSRILNKCFEQ